MAKKRKIPPAFSAPDAIAAVNRILANNNNNMTHEARTGLGLRSDAQIKQFTRFIQHLKASNVSVWDPNSSNNEENNNATTTSTSTCITSADQPLIPPVVPLQQHAQPPTSDAQANKFTLNGRTYTVPYQYFDPRPNEHAAVL